jgi:lipopolysaccharide transport system ATP-binding protein
MVYPAHGARIHSVEIISQAGEIVNNIPFGHPFKVRIGYQADEDIAGVRLACHIANHTGSRITGQIMPMREDPGLRFSAGSEWQMCCDFLGCLWPGTYFVGAGIISTLNPETKHIHRVIDLGVFRIISAGSPQQIGVANLAPTMASIRPMGGQLRRRPAGEPGAET